MKTSELTGTALDWAVAKCEAERLTVPYGGKSFLDGVVVHPDYNKFYPSTNWAQGGMIIEREKLGVWWAHHVVDAEGNEYGNHWYSETGLTDENADERHVCMEGETPLVAAMRCYVASKLGDEVEIPKELT